MFCPGWVSMSMHVFCLYGCWFINTSWNCAINYSLCTIGMCALCTVNQLLLLIFHHYCSSVLNNLLKMLALCQCNWWECPNELLFVCVCDEISNIFSVEWQECVSVIECCLEFPLYLCLIECRWSNCNSFLNSNLPITLKLTIQ